MQGEVFESEYRRNTFEEFNGEQYERDHAKILYPTRSIEEMERIKAEAWAQYEEYKKNSSERQEIDAEFNRINEEQKQLEQAQQQEQAPKYGRRFTDEQLEEMETADDNHWSDASDIYIDPNGTIVERFH